jgi:inhibitor of cysteine peptidase
VHIVKSLLVCNIQYQSEYDTAIIKIKQVNTFLIGSKKFSRGRFMKKILRSIAVLLFVITIVFAAGCAGKTGNNTENNTRNATQGNTDQLEPIYPAIPENVTVNNTTQVNETTETGQIVTEGDNGKTISLNNGGYFTLKLEEDPTTGYEWELNLSKGLVILDDEYVERPNPQHLEGVPGTHSWLIEAVAPGNQKVTGIYKRFQGNTTGIEENFTLNVDVV